RLWRAKGISFPMPFKLKGNRWVRQTLTFPPVSPALQFAGSFIANLNIFMKHEANTPRDGGATRREFIKKSTLAAAGVAASASIFKTPVYGQDQAPSPGSVVGANNRLVVAYIGTGPQGMAHVRTQKAGAAAN